MTTGQDALAEELAVRRCAKCREVKPLTDYPERTKGYCRPCKRSYSRELYDRNREYRRRYSYEAAIQRLYGITLEEREAIWEAQGRRCKICHSTGEGQKRRMHVDHDHDTGKIRGLLCHPCNIMLGGAKDSIEVLEKAIAYLRSHA